MQELVIHELWDNSYLCIWNGIAARMGYEDMVNLQIAFKRMEAECE